MSVKLLQWLAWNEFPDVNVWWWFKGLCHCAFLACVSQSHKWSQLSGIRQRTWLLSVRKRLKYLWRIISGDFQVFYWMFIHTYKTAGLSVAAWFVADRSLNCIDQAEGEGLSLTPTVHVESIWSHPMWYMCEWVFRNVTSGDLPDDEKELKEKY